MRKIVTTVKPTKTVITVIHGENSNSNAKSQKY